MYPAADRRSASVGTRLSSASRNRCLTPWRGGWSPVNTVAWLTGVRGHDEIAWVKLTPLARSRSMPGYFPEKATSARTVSREMNRMFGCVVTGIPRYSSVDANGPER